MLTLTFWDETDTHIQGDLSWINADVFLWSNVVKSSVIIMPENDYYTELKENKLKNLISETSVPKTLKKWAVAAS